LKHKKLHITFYLFLIWSFCFSQQYTNYTTKNSLPSNHVYKIAQDAKGFIWIATDKGLVKYNGNKMKTFTTRNGLATNDVWGILPTPDGKVWYLSKASKLGYIENDSVFAFESEIKNEIFNSIFTSQIGNEVILTSGSKSHRLINDKWKLIVDNKLYSKTYNTYVKHKNISHFETNATLDSITIIDNNKQPQIIIKFKSIISKIHNRGQITDSLFFWTSNEKYSILNLNTLKTYNRSFKEELGIDASQYTRINNVINELQITGRGFVGVLDSNYHIKNEVYLPDELDAHFALIDKSKNVWISTFTNGLYKLSKAKRNINYCLPEDKILNTTLVKNKLIANIYNKGFYKYDAKNKNFTPFISEKDYVFGSTYIDSLNTEYYISRNAITRIKNGDLNRINFSNTLAKTNDLSRQLVYFESHLYSIFSIGIKKLNPNDLSALTEYHQQGINYLYVFNDKLLIATTNGLKQLEDNTTESIKFKNETFNKSILNITRISNSDVLLSTDGFGAFITDLNTVTQLPNTEFLTINNAFVDNKTIWLATDVGVLKYIKSDGNFTLTSQLNMSNGLPSKNVNDVFVDKNNLIVSTNSGIAILPKDQEGISQFLDVYIENTTFNNTKVITDGSVFKSTNNNQININVSSIDFSENNKDFTYSYKLEPLQKQWTQTASNSLNFSDLAPHNYKLSITRNDITKTLQFKITPRWWQTFWFKLILALISIALVVLIVSSIFKKSQFKKTQQLLQDKRLTEIQLKALRAQMNPHFVFNSLAAIQYYINNNDFDNSETYLVKFSKLIRQFFELTKETEITLADEIKLLENYLDIEKLRFKDKFNYLIKVDKALNVASTKIPTMLLQPIVENAVNHGIFNKLENGKIDINFNFIDKDTFKVEIIDDGVGFVNTKKISSEKVKSSSVLKDRLYYLNQSKKWHIDYYNEEVNPNLEDKGNKSVFNIKHLVK